MPRPPPRRLAAPVSGQSAPADLNLEYTRVLAHFGAHRAFGSYTVGALVTASQTTALHHFAA
jgi:hypothetical protein